MGFYNVTDFICFDFNDFIAFFDGIAFLLQPGRYGTFCHGQA